MQHSTSKRLTMPLGLRTVYDVLFDYSGKACAEQSEEASAGTFYLSEEMHGAQRRAECELEKLELGVVGRPHWYTSPRPAGDMALYSSLLRGAVFVRVPVDRRFPVAWLILSAHELPEEDLRITGYTLLSVPANDGMEWNNNSAVWCMPVQRS